MAHDHDHDAPSTSENLENIETLDQLDAIEDCDEEIPSSGATDDEDDVEIVHSSELLEPLGAADVIDLDYDEDIPTGVDGCIRRERRESYPPPRVDEEDVFLLTEHRPSMAGSREARVQISECVLPARLPTVVPPPRRDTIAPAKPRQHEMSSIAPVALPPETATERRRAEPETTGSRTAYRSMVAALASAAAILAVWPSTPSGAADGTEHRAQPAAAAPGAAEADPMGASPKSKQHRLEEVAIVADTSPAPVAAGTVASDKAPRVPAGPPSHPSHEVVIDDAAQLSGEVVFPHDASGTEEPVDEASAEPEAPAESSDTPMTAPEPPTHDPLPFDRSAAAAAMNAAAGMTSSCPAPATGQATVRVSVTFASTGRVTTAIANGKGVSGTATGSCIARKFQSIRLDAFQGPPVTVHKSFRF